MRAIMFIAIIATFCLSFYALDRWHQRYAWRNARRSTERMMRMRRGEPPL